MTTMKKFFKYLLIFIALYLILDFLAFASMQTLQKDITNYAIETENPKIEITKSTAGYSNIMIEGNITNNTSEIINKTYIKISFYNRSGRYITSKYQEIKYLNVGETTSLNVEYKLNNVESFKVNTTQEIPVEETRKQTQFEKTFIKWWPAIGIISFIYFLT